MASTLTTLARPYAIAAFEHASAKQALSAWEEVLRAAATVTQNNLVARLLTNPAVTTTQLKNLFCETLAAILDNEQRNFISLLAENKRLPILPDIAELFASYRAIQEKTAIVRLVSAIALDEKYQQKMEKSLAKRLQRHVLLKCEVDSTLLGGAVIHVDDMVIDGSVRGKLNRLIEYL